jgi:HlyD family secretion protein
MIDGKGVELQKEQVLASINAIDEKTNSANPQIQVLQSQMNSQKANISVLQEQLSTAVRERNRVSNLVKSDAATKKQLDDTNSQVAVIQKQISVANAQLQTLNQQIASTKEQVSIQNRAILSEKNPNQKKVLQIDDQLKHNIIASPINGTVLTKYMYKGEFATIGKPIYKIANLDEMLLRAYFTGDQLAKIKVGQTVKILVDAGNGETKELNGKIEWISQKSEFTPKTIQTKDERANLVYASKIRVKNDGFLKIGMYGEVKL